MLAQLLTIAQHHHQAGRLTEAAHACPQSGDWTVEIASDGLGEGEPYAGTLNPGQALVLRPTEA